jgi:5-methylcytosine-specific restriction endonuclease McrA
MMPRTCIGGSGPCSDGGIAVSGRSRCRNHGGLAWARRGSISRNYNDPVYLRNREILLAGNPICHWCGIRPATQADHLRSDAGHELSNLVPACADCNQRRGGAEGRATMKARAAARRRQRG